MPRKFTLQRLVEDRRADEAAGSPEVDRSALERFATAAPGLRRLLASAPASDRELLLRAEMRRTMAMLAATFDEAACREKTRTRAAAYRAAARVAEDLACAGAALVATPATRDH